MKTCNKCHRELPEEQFHKSQKNKDGYQNMCKECTAAYAKARYASMKAAGGAMVFCRSSRLGSCWMS